MKNMINPFEVSQMDCFLTCPRGLEEVTVKDVSSHCSDPEISTGGVSFKGDLKTLYNVNLYSRTGMFLLVKILEFKADNDNDLYYNIADYPWYEWITPDDTFSIRSRVYSKHFNDANYVTLKVKDAIVDRIRQRTKRRPNIARENPRYSLFVFIHENKVSMFINSSGETLSKRGYRQKIHKAAINEALGAGLILLSGWDPKTPFYDPMCGSGTLPIEAAMIAKNIPGGNYKKSFAFKMWKNFDPRLWNSVIKESREKITNDRLFIYGSDSMPANIDMALRNARQILIHTNIKFKTKEFEDFKPDSEGGTILMNPPYGERIGEEDELKNLYALIGHVLKQSCINTDAFIFSGNKDLTKMIGLKSHRNYVLRNGKIDCRLLHYPIKEGSYTD